MEKMIDFVASLIRNFPKYTSPMAITKKKPSTIVPMSRSTAVRTNKRVRCGYQDQLYRFVNKLLDIIIVSDRIWKKNGTNKGTFGIIIYGANQHMLLHNLAGKQHSLHKLVLSCVSNQRIRISIRMEVVFCISSNQHALIVLSWHGAWHWYVHWQKTYKWQSSQIQITNNTHFVTLLYKLVLQIDWTKKTNVCMSILHSILTTTQHIKASNLHSFRRTTKSGIIET